MLLMDGGDFLPRVIDRREEPKALLCWGEMERLGYDAVALGEIELRHWDLIERLMTEMPLPVVSTNVEHLRDGLWLPVGEKYSIVECNGARIGVISTITEELFGQTTQEFQDRLRVLPPMPEIERAVAALEAQVDVIVLLAHMDPKALEQLASLVEGVDIVLGGHVTQIDTMPMRLAEVIVNRSGTRGQALAATRLIVSPDGQIADFGGTNVILGPNLSEDPGVLAAIEAAKQKTAEIPSHPLQPTLGPGTSSSAIPVRTEEAKPVQK
ncbi:MAG: hypothetical protein V1774_01570 [Candidatus Eisenbacteria bacterium]